MSSATPLMTIDGTVTIRGTVAISADSVASVKLVDSTGEVLAATAVIAHGVPVAFTLHADPAFLTTRGSLLMWAALRTETDLFGTPDLVPVTDDVIELVLHKIED